MKFKEWDGNDLIGTYLVTIKKDGIQCLNIGGEYVFKGGNLINNLPSIMKNFQIAEIFCNSWNETMSITSASVSERREIKQDEIFPLVPEIDKRLVITKLINPAKEVIQYIFDKYVRLGHEGLVLHGDNGILIKVKPKYTKDAKITGYVEGRGRLVGMLGKFTTDEGDCGVGFSDEQRTEFWKIRDSFIGKYIEMEAMEKTINNKFRNPRFVRIRNDK